MSKEKKTSSFEISCSVFCGSLFITPETIDIVLLNVGLASAPARKGSHRGLPYSGPERAEGISPQAGQQPVTIR